MVQVLNPVGVRDFSVLQIPSRPDNVPVGLSTSKEYHGNTVHRIATELILDFGFWILIQCNLLGDYQRSNKHSASIFRIISQTLPVNLALRLHLRACPLPGLVHSSHRVFRGLQQFTWQLAQALGILSLRLRPATTRAVQQPLAARGLTFLRNPTNSKTAMG